MTIFIPYIPYLIIIAIIIGASVKMVPQQEAWIVERLGKFKAVLEPGLNFVIPFIDMVSYKHSLKEQAMAIKPQNAISKDNVTLEIDGVLYVKVFDAKKASYGAEDPYYAITQLAQTTMRSEIGKLSLDKTFEEREYLNSAIVKAINEASASWGMECLRYEIKDIHPPVSVVQAMELQMAAERKKRAQILESEGVRQAKINNAEAEKTQVVLSSEAAYTDQVNRARGEAEAIEMVATATANSLSIIAKSIGDKEGKDAISFRLAEGYIESFGKLAKHSNTIVIPAELSNPSGFISSALAIFNNLDNGMEKKGKK
jgi:regulator of protease activity HflC (stomatin/prohibitin superfamily)